MLLILWKASMTTIIDQIHLHKNYIIILSIDKNGKKCGVD